MPKTVKTSRMKERIKSAGQVILALAFLAFLAWGLIRVLIGLASWIGGLDSDVAKAVVAAGATVLASVLALVGSKAYEARSAVRQDLRVKKTPIYEDIVTTLYRVMFASMLDEAPLSEKELTKFFAQTTERLTIWGSDSLLKSWGRWKTQVGDPEKGLFTFEDLLLAIRKDLGHRNRGLQRGSILRLFVTDIDDYLKKQK